MARGIMFILFLIRNNNNCISVCTRSLLAGAQTTERLFLLGHRFTVSEIIQILRGVGIYPKTCYCCRSCGFPLKLCVHNRPARGGSDHSSDERYLLLFRFRFMCTYNYYPSFGPLQILLMSFIIS